MANFFGWRRYEAAVASNYSGIEIEVASDVEIAIWALGNYYGAIEAVLSVDAASLLNTAQTARTPAAQFGEDSSYTLQSSCYSGNATTFSKVNDGFKLAVDVYLSLLQPLVVPAGKHLHILTPQQNQGVEVGILFEERPAHADLMPYGPDSR